MTNDSPTSTISPASAADVPTIDTGPKVRDPGAPQAGLATPVLILGGGIGGLAAALALARRGIASRVLERRPTFSPEGAGIQLGPNGTRILAEIGVAAALDPLAGKPHIIHVRSAATGDTLANLPLGAWAAERHGSPYWVTHRRDLHGALLATAEKQPLISITMGFNAGAIRDEGRAVTITETGTGNVVTGACLIAADGLRSQVRRDVFAAPPPHYAGKSSARAVIAAEDLPRSLRENATAIWLAPGAHIVHYPLRGSNEVAIVYTRDDRTPSEDWNAEVPRDWVLDGSGRFADALRLLLKVPRQWRKWALYELAPLPHWVKGRIALLGDAAHPTLPFLAQGGVLALEDASVIAREIATRPADCAAALAAYEHARMDRATRVVAQAKKNGRIYHLDGVMALARNLTMKLTPADRLMARFDWVYGWKG